MKKIFLVLLLSICLVNTVWAGHHDHGHYHRHHPYNHGHHRHHDNDCCESWANASIAITAITAFSNMLTPPQQTNIYNTTVRSAPEVYIQPTPEIIVPAPIPMGRYVWMNGRRYYQYFENGHEYFVPAYGPHLIYIDR